MITLENFKVQQQELQRKLQGFCKDITPDSCFLEKAATGENINWYLRTNLNLDLSFYFTTEIINGRRQTVLVFIDSLEGTEQGRIYLKYF